MSNVSKENYLKTIFNYNHGRGESAVTTKLAHDLSVSNAAISDMAKKLSKDGLIFYKKYQGIELTEKGQKIALEVIRRHRLWELFLVKVLHLSWSEVHDQAEALEHNTSEFLIDKIDEYLGYPEFDPHGKPIPKRNGSLPKVEEYILLSDAVHGCTYRLVQVNEKDNKLINYLSKIGLLLNTEFEVVDKLDFDNSITICFENKSFLISQKISENIYVKQLKKYSNNNK